MRPGLRGDRGRRFDDHIGRGHAANHDDGTAGKVVADDVNRGPAAGGTVIGIDARDGRRRGRRPGMAPAAHGEERSGSDGERPPRQVRKRESCPQSGFGQEEAFDDDDVAPGSVGLSMTFVDADLAKT